MRTPLPRPDPRSILYEDGRLYACLAGFPIAPGHVVVVWKKRVRDLHLLGRKDYEYLLDKVDAIRTALIKALRVRKVYLIYMDEAGQVHWHLVPRYNIRGYNVFLHRPGKLKDFSLVDRIRRLLRHA